MSKFRNSASTTQTINFRPKTIAAAWNVKKWCVPCSFIFAANHFTTHFFEQRITEHYIWVCVCVFVCECSVHVVSWKIDHLTNVSIEKLSSIFCLSPSFSNWFSICHQTSEQLKKKTDAEPKTKWVNFRCVCMLLHLINVIYIIGKEVTYGCDNLSSFGAFHNILLCIEQLQKLPLLQQ